MDLQDNRIWEIIAAFLCGEEMTDADASYLQQWLENENHRRVFMRLEHYYKEQSVRKTIDEEKACHSVFEKIQRQKSEKRRVLLRWWGSVASIVGIGFAVTFVLLRMSAYQPIEMAGKEIVTSGNGGVTLYLAGGKQILLDNKNDRIVSDKYGIVYNRQGVLSFEACIGEADIDKKYNLLNVPRGKEYQVLLPDSTRVWLNADSRLRYPLAFGLAERRVFLEGEAYFDVKKRKDRPFVVETDRMDIEVLGTCFDVRAYKDEKTVYTTLVTGAVRILPGGMAEREIELKPSQQYILDRQTMRQEVMDVDPLLYTAWIDQMFVFRDRRLEDVMMDLCKWYDVEFVFADKISADVKISGNIERSRDLSAVLDMVIRLNKVEIEKQSGKYVIRAK